MTIHLHPSFSQSEKPFGSVLLAHGFGEHRGRYSRFIHALNEAGYDAWSFDFTGHGRAEGPRAQVDVGVLIGEHLEARKELMQVARTERIFLFGHSMGGLITLASTLLSPTHLVATAVTGPALRPLPHIDRRLARAGARLGTLLPALKSVELDVHLLSHDPQVALDYGNDPLVYKGKVPLLTGASMVVQGDQVIRNAQILACPVLILHGEDDGLADVDGSIEFADAAGDLVEIETYPGAYHELLNEPEQETYRNRIINWYNQW